MRQPTGGPFPATLQPPACVRAASLISFSESLLACASLVQARDSSMPVPRFRLIPAGRRVVELFFELISSARWAHILEFEYLVADLQ